MPGIVGLITKMPRNEAEEQLQKMVTALHHEPSYVTGRWTDESLGAYVGWVARKDSFSDGMPLRNENGDVVLVFSGEEFPESGAISRLKQRGHVLEAAEASYLVHMYEDEEFPSCLNGRFHGLLADRNANKMVLFNDRYGMHRLYFHESNEAFYFAAEAKAILAVCPELRRFDLRSIGEFVACGCVLENRSLFQQIQVVPPASAWVFANGSLEQRTAYFDPRQWENQEPLEPESYYQELRDVFSRILPRYFNGPERVGMSLTGGLDTRMIMAWHKAPPNTLACYTFGGTVRNCQDVIVSREVARACQQPHEVIPVGEEFLSHFAEYAERAIYLSDGCVNVNRSADLYVNQQASKIAPVRMTGNFGGEVLRKIRAFKPTRPSIDLFHPELLNHVVETEKTYARLLEGHPLSFAVFRQAPWHHYGLLALEQTQLSLRSPYLDNDFVRTVFRAPESACANDAVCLRLIGEGDTVVRRIRTDRGVGGTQGPVGGKALQEFLEFTFKAEYAYDVGMPQWLARIDHLFSPFHFERLFLGRHKFCHFRIWYRDALSDYIQEMLLDRRTLSRPYVQRKSVEAMVHGHTKGDRNYTTEIHTMLTLELMHRIFLD